MSASRSGDSPLISDPKGPKPSVDEAELAANRVRLGHEGAGDRRAVAEELLEHLLAGGVERRVLLGELDEGGGVDVQRAEPLLGQLVERVDEALGIAQAVGLERVQRALQVVFTLAYEQQILGHHGHRVVGGLVALEVPELAAGLGVLALGDRRLGGLRVGHRHGHDEAGLVRRQVVDADRALRAEPRLDVLGVALALLRQLLVEQVGQRLVAEEALEQGVDVLALVALGAHDGLEEDRRVGRNRLRGIRPTARHRLRAGVVVAATSRHRNRGQEDRNQPLQAHVRNRIPGAGCLANAGKSISPACPSEDVVGRKLRKVLRCGTKWATTPRDKPVRGGGAPPTPPPRID